MKTRLDISVFIITTLFSLAASAAEEVEHASCQGAVTRHTFPKDGKLSRLLYSGPGGGGK